MLRNFGIVTKHGAGDSSKSRIARYLRSGQSSTKDVVPSRKARYCGAATVGYGTHGTEERRFAADTYAWAVAGLRASFSDDAVSEKAKALVRELAAIGDSVAMKSLREAARAFGTVEVTQLTELKCQVADLRRTIEESGLAHAMRDIRRYALEAQRAIALVVPSHSEMQSPWSAAAFSAATWRAYTSSGERPEWARRASDLLEGLGSPPPGAPPVAAPAIAEARSVFWRLVELGVRVDRVVRSSANDVVLYCFAADSNGAEGPPRYATVDCDGSGIVLVSTNNRETGECAVREVPAEGAELDEALRWLRGFVG